MLNRLNIATKFLAVVVACVIGAITVLTLLIIGRESVLIRSADKKKAEIVVMAISRALRDNMIEGRPEDTRRLIKALMRVDGVRELGVAKNGGGYAFGTVGPPISLATFVHKYGETRDVSLSVGGAKYLTMPLKNGRACRRCHAAGRPLRGLVVVRMSSGDVQRNIVDLVKRMALFGFIAALLLSGILVAVSRRMLLSPIKGLTEAARQIAHGNFVFFRGRGTHCHDMLGCEKTACPSYGDATVPCWLQSGTLCGEKPSGLFALKLGNCQKCDVYKDLRGDEIVQLQDSFNRMSMTLKRQEEAMTCHVKEVESLNDELAKSNTKLRTLLDASRLTSSTLELQSTLSSTLKMILDVTNLKVGVILLLEEDLTSRCYEFFDCNAQNCPAYRAEVNCWRLSGTMCHGDASGCPDSLGAMECWAVNHIHSHLEPSLNYDDKFRSCSACAFFANTVLIPKMVAGFTNGHLGERIKLDSSTIHKALMLGHTMVNYSMENPFKVPIDTVTEVAMPLKVKSEITGVLYLASDEAHKYTEDEMSFFQFLSEVISSGVFNSRLFEDVEVSYFQTVMALANAIEAKDPYTRGHSERVADLSMKAAEALHLSRQEKEHLRFAAILHDVGKIGISMSLLRKDTDLEGDERDEMRSHPERGVQILQPIHFLKPVLPAIRHHHERYDGTGYPMGLKGREIPFKARIIAVADAWDAMLSDRPYRSALPMEDVKREMLDSRGTQFDPDVVDFFVSSLT